MGYSFKVLREEVSEEDLFEGKTHEHVSDNLFKLIHENDKAMTIGLEGGWGSGKSTVLNLLRKRLEETKILYFMFDAWAHTDDPLRRIFLESFIGEIKAKDKIASLETLLLKINGRQRKVQVKTSKSASRLGELIAFSALFIPFGVALISAVDLSKLLSCSSIDILVSVLGLFFTLSPLLVILYWKIFGDKDEVGKVRWDIFEGKSEEIYEQEVEDDGERTSIEFETYFHSILESLFKDNKDYDFEKVVIVVDNLDRVEPDAAKNIWSTLQTFFQHRSQAGKVKEKKYLDKLWFIIPYDREGLSSIWESERKSVNEVEGERIKSTPGDSKTYPRRDVAKSFLEKSFQIVAEVPTPVMSSWSKYLSEKINDALAEWPEIERKDIYESYVRCNSRLAESPTPRKICSFVNRLGFIGQQWGGLVSAEAMTIYTVLRQKYSESELRSKLLLPSFPEGIVTKADPEEIKMELAGLLFGVDKNKGIELLLSPKIKDALQEGNGDVLNELVEIHGEAFWIAWNESRSNGHSPNGINNDGQYRINFTRALHDGLSGFKGKIEKDVKETILSWEHSFNHLKFNEFQYIESFERLLILSEVNKNSILEGIKSGFTKGLDEQVNLVKNEKFSIEALSELSRVEEFLIKNNVNLKRFKQPHLNIDNWPIWLNLLNENDLSFHSTLPKDGVISGLIGQVGFGNPALDSNKLNILVDTFDVWSNCDEWKQVPPLLRQWALINNRDPNNESAYRLATRIIGNVEGKETTSLKKAFEEANYWAIASNEDLSVVKTMPVLIGSVFQDELQGKDFISKNVKSYWAEPKGDAEIKAVLSIFKENALLETIWYIAIDKRNKFASQLLKGSDGDFEVELYSSDIGAEHIDELQSWASDDDLEKMVSLLCKHGGFEKAKEVISEEPLNYHAVIYLFKNYGDQSSQLFLTNLISNLAKDSWINSFEKGNDLLFCVKDVSHEYKDAFIEFMQDVVTGTRKAPDEFWNNFEFLLTNVQDAFITLEKLTKKYFGILDGEKLGEYGFLIFRDFMDSHLKEVPESHIIQKIDFWLTNGYWNNLDWISKQFQSKSMEPLESLKTRIEERFQNDEDPEHIQTLDRLAQIFSISLKKIKDE